MASPPKEIPLAAKSLIDTCVTCARHTCKLLSSSWINGAFPPLYHDLTQYLFSAMTVLAVSSLLHHDDILSDKEWFEESVRLLDQLRDTGNYSAREFHRHVKLIIAALGKVEEEKQKGGSGGFNDTAAAAAITVLQQQQQHARVEGPPIGILVPGLGGNPPHATSMSAGDQTAEAALAEPSLQEFLLQPAIDMQFPDVTMEDFFSEGDGLYWPDYFDFHE